MTASSQHHPPLAAGPFGAWLQAMRDSLRGDAGTDVPCGDCVGCCVSSYFIPIRFKDQAARSVIPKELLVQAPGQPPGHAMLGYREDGTCPMLKLGKCSIYAQRPQTCRDYDCRIFAAAGLTAGGADKAVINERVQRWQFSYESDQERRAHAAVRAAATFIRTRKEAFPNARAPTAATGIAVLAVKTYEIFMDPAVTAIDDSEVAAAIMKASAEFDACA